MKIKIESYHIEKFVESSVNFLFDVHLEDGIIGTCNVWIQDIFHKLQFVDEGGNQFLFQQCCQQLDSKLNENNCDVENGQRVGSNVIFYETAFSFLSFPF